MCLPESEFNPAKLCGEQGIYCIGQELAAKGILEHR